VTGKVISASEKPGEVSVNYSTRLRHYVEIYIVSV